MNFEYFLQSLAGGILIGGVYSLVAIGLNLIVGVLGIVSFAHGSLLMLGMYVSYYLFSMMGVDPYISILFSGPVLFITGLIIQKIFIMPVIEKPHSAVLLVTLGVSIVIDNLAAFFCGHDYRMIRVPYGDSTISLGSVILSIPKLVAFSFSIFGTLLFFLFLKKTRIGKAIRAVASEKEGAMFVGVNVGKIYLVTFALGSAIAGIGGSLILPFYSVSPYAGMTFVIYGFIVMVLGGMGNLWGSLVGGIIIGACEGVASMFFGPALRHLVSYLFFIVILLVRPEGLFGERLETN